MYHLSPRNGFPYPTISTIQISETRRDEDENTYKCTSYTHGSAKPIHGLQKILNTRRFTRLFWILLMLAILGVAIYFSVIMAKDYKDFQTTTRISIIQNSSLNMPSIHVCPKNPDNLELRPIYRDITDRVGNITLEQKKNLLTYYIAGSGLQNSGLETLSQSSIEESSRMFIRWQGNRTLEQLFNFVFNEHGVKCEHILKNCSMSGVSFDCCKNFKPHYVMLRGKCIRLDPLKQTGTSEKDKLRLQFTKPGSLLATQELQKQYVFYMGDWYPEIYFIPRYYYNVVAFGQISIRARKIRMLHRNDTCNFGDNLRGRSTCFVNNWIRENLAEPHHCTLPYLRDLKISEGLPICHPSTVIPIYNQLVTATNVKYKCNLNCDRWDYIYKYSEKHGILSTNSYTIDIYFTDLMYELYSEIKMVSFTSFISQIGGQAVLFLGTSIISVIYLMESIVINFIIYVRKKTRK